MTHAVILVLFFVLTTDISFGETVFKLDFDGKDLLNPSDRRFVVMDSKLPADKQLFLLEPQVFREPKFNFVKGLRDNAERIIGGVFILGIAMRVYKRFQEESPVRFSQYENGVKLKAQWKLGKE